MSDLHTGMHAPIRAGGDLAGAGSGSNAPSVATHPLASLHQAIGNAAVVQRLAEDVVQPKMEIGLPGDPHEREADAVADQVMRAPSSGADVSPAADGIARAPLAASIQRAPDDSKKQPDAAKAGPPPAAKAAAPKAPAPSKAPSAAPPVAVKAPAVPKAPGAPKAPPNAPPATAAASQAALPAAALAATPGKAKAPPRPNLEAAPKPAPGTAKKRKRKGAVPAADPFKQPKGYRPPPGARADGLEVDAPDAAGPDDRRADDDMIAAKANPGAVPTVTPSAAATIQSSKGSGQPLPTAERSFFESRLGRDLSGVRVHDNASANHAAKDIQAKAFTYGQDVYFGAGQYQPGSTAGRRLMAHELAHTIQQRPGAKVDRQIQRADAPKQTTPTPAAAKGVVLDEGSKTIEFPDLEVPGFRLRGPGSDPAYTAPLTRPKGYERSEAEGEASQRELWDKASAAGVTARLSQLAGYAPHADGKYQLKSVGKGMPTRFYVGDATTVGERLTRPDWDSTGAGHMAPGKLRGFEVDHRLELQLGGKNEVANLVLFDAAKNGASGNFIKNSIRNRVDRYIETLDPAEQKRLKLKPDGWQDRWNTRFLTGVPAKKPGFQAPTAKDFWTLDAIKGGEHLLPNVVVNAEDGDFGSATGAKIFQRDSGGIPSTIDPRAAITNAKLKRFFAPYVPLTQEWWVGKDATKNPESLATFTYELGPKAKKRLKAETTPLTVPRFNGMPYAGAMSKNGARQMLANLGAKEMSPIEIDEADVTPDGLMARGRIITDLPLLKGAQLDLEMLGDKLTVSKTFALGDFKVPKPLTITQSSLTISASTDGDLAVSGRVDAEVDRLGKGFLEGHGSIERGFALKGGFDFTSDLFDPAHIEFGYADGHVSAAGKIGVGKGKVPGVKSALLDVSYANDVLTADGQAEFTIPGVTSADVHLVYDPEHGLQVTGHTVLGTLPGIRSGDLTVSVVERPGGAGYKVSGHGTAEPAIPGIKSQLTLDYDDGAFLAQLDAPFAQGMLSGSIQAGATNRPVDDEGKIDPAGAPQADIVIFGAGVATLDFGWLQGTAGIKLLPNGEVALKGELAIPGKELYPGKDFSRDLVKSPRISFPIFGPVVLEVLGGIRLNAGIGPGILSGSLGIDYNPSHEDQTKVHGNAHFHASAYAGLELYSQITVGLDAWIGSISGGIELGAELRIDPVLDIDVPLQWSPGAGLKIDPTLTASLNPSLKFHLSALVVASVGPFEKEWKKDLADREFGSNLNLGLTMPVHYEEGKPFNPSLDDIEIHKPEIDPFETAKDFLESLV